ncbi:MDM2 [Acanthosepion pharaonis]|uniref:MDM2 n=1 Tax=Acanthosepion pharaonis TaxID=158019 RepID=A0A812ELE9_ACAPH|nr:MDM2 [Sepia pharaonis]
MEKEGEIYKVAGLGVGCNFFYFFYVMERPVLNEHRNKLSRNSTPSASTTASTPASVNSKVYPKPKFLKLLQSVGAKGKAFQVSEIINYLKEYISSKRLFDQQQPWIVHCENDYLGSVFHCKQFTIDDVRGLLNQNVTVCKSEVIDGNEDESFDSDATEILVSSMSDSDHEPPKKTTPLDDIISSSTSESPKPIFSFSSTDPLLRVNSSFLEILQDVGAKGEVFREKEIFRYLKNYVWSRRLFDPKHPWICLCHNDKLANVFRCNKFLIHDVPHLVAKFGVEYPGYRPTVLRTSSDVPPKTASAIALPLHRHMSSPGRTQSTPSDITSSTADVIAPTFTDHIEEQTSGRSEESVPAATLRRSEESVPAATLRRSEESVPAATLCSSEESVPAATLCRSEESVPAVTLCRSEESVPAAAPNRSDENVLAAPSTSEESDLPAALTRGRGSDLPSVHRRSRESELPESSSRPTNSFTLTLGMKDEEFLSFQSEEPVDDVYVEYEVMSNSTSFHMSDSEEEHHKVSMDMLVICQDSDIECYADYSDTGSDTDVELSEADKWCCSNCHLYNSPIHRLCDRCWTLRPGWLPDRDKQSSPKPKDSCEHSSKQLQNQIKSSLENLRSKTFVYMIGGRLHFSFLFFSFSFFLFFFFLFFFFLFFSFFLFSFLFSLLFSFLFSLLFFFLSLLFLSLLFLFSFFLLFFSSLLFSLFSSLFLFSSLLYFLFSSLFSFLFSIFFSLLFFSSLLFFFSLLFSSSFLFSSLLLFFFSLLFSFSFLYQQ